MLRLSASRLTTYQRCAQAYYLKYHRRVPGRPIRAAVLGNVLHQVLEHLYQRPAWQGVPTLTDLERLWGQHNLALSPQQLTEGWSLLHHYFQTFIQPLDAWVEPIGIEGRLRGALQAGGIRFRLEGRYDRLDSLPSNGLQAAVHLIDYKMTRQIQNPSELELDLQLGFYQMAIDQVYGAALKQVSHIYLRTGQCITFKTSPEQKAFVQAKVTELAETLVQDQSFTPNPGDQCQTCTCRPYCAAVTADPIPLDPKSEILQLSFL